RADPGFSGHRQAARVGEAVRPAAQVDAAAEQFDHGTARIHDRVVARAEVGGRVGHRPQAAGEVAEHVVAIVRYDRAGDAAGVLDLERARARSEERRVGKEWGARGSRQDGETQEVRVIGETEDTASTSGQEYMQ